MRKKKDKHSEPLYCKNNDKHSRSKTQHSLIQRHEQYLKEFDNVDSKVKTIDCKIKSVEQELKKLQVEMSFKKLNNENSFDIMQKIDKLKAEISSLQATKIRLFSGEEKIEYLLESSQLISKFLDIEKKEQELLENFKNTESSSELINEISKQKALIVDEYLHKFDPNYNNMKLAQIHYSFCKQCKCEMEIEGGFFVCPMCGICLQSLDCNVEPSYKELQDYDIRPQFTYDKMTHLEDWLRRFQSKENRAIPQHILDMVIIKAKEERIKDLNLLTEDKVKRYLKKLELNEYYDNVIGIINRINGRPPFRLTTEVEDKIKMMFQQIQEPFMRYKPEGRRNFLSYSYTLHKFFQILGLFEFAKYFPLLKSDDKLRQQDEIFKKIVAEMAQRDKSIKWVFYPSI